LVQRRRNFSGFKTIAIQSWKDQNDNIKIKCPLNKDFSPEEISAVLLINDATNYLGQVTQAVITVPYFNDSQDKQRWMLENCRS
jgi:molecular chaperone DnaK (HSP70)